MLQTLRKMACSVYEPLTQANLLSLVGPTSGAYAMLSPLPLDRWKIISFDSANALVCIQMDAPSGSRIINVKVDISAMETPPQTQPRQFNDVHPTGQYTPH
jgi:hypothetical protein